MVWTDEDEREHRRRLRAELARLDREDRDRRLLVDRGVVDGCPVCGGHRYFEGVKVELCEDCGYSQSY